MAISFDGINKIISLSLGTHDISVKEIYSRWIDWVASSDNSKYLQAIRFVGGDILPGSKELGITFFLLNGWKIRPAEENHVLNLNGNLYSEDGSSPFIPVLGSYNVTVINSVSSLVDSTVQQLPEIEHASFNGGVTIDAVNGTDSIEYPYGTSKYPCKTTANSYNIRMIRGFNKIFVKSDITLIGIPDGVLNGLEIIGLGGYRQHTLTIDNVLVTNCVGTNINITGTCKNGSSARVNDCNVYDLENAKIYANNSQLSSGIYKETELVHCSLVGHVIVKNDGRLSGAGVIFEGDFSNITMGTNSTISLDIDSGYVEIKGSTTGCLAEFNMKGGELEINANCIGGDLYVEGYGLLYNNGSMNIKANNLISEYLPGDVMGYTGP